MKRSLIVGIIGAAALTMTACSQPNISVEPVTSASASAAPAEASKSEAWDTITQFVQAQWDDKAKEALALTAPGSPAFKYATYQLAADEAYRTNGQSESVTNYSYVDDPDAGTVTITDSSTTPATEYVWSDFDVDPQGRVVSWTGASGPLEEALWTKDVSVKAGPASAELVGAYKTNSGVLSIVLDVKAGPKGASLNTPSYIVDGRSSEPTFWLAPSDVEPGARAYHVYHFEGADFGGTFVADVSSGDYTQTGKISFTVA